MGGSSIAYLARREPGLRPVMTLSGDSAPPDAVHPSLMVAKLRAARASSRPGAILSTLILAAGLGLSGCGPSGSTVDGFKLGVVVKCSPPVDVDAATLDRSCAGFFKRAMAALDARDPGHAAVVSVATYTDGTQPEPIDMTGDGPPPTPAARHPGPNFTVFVYTLADGSIRATGVACGDVKPTVCVGVASYPN
jgi:hypothetical protein